MKIGNITFDCHDPEVLARFWAKALGYEMPELPAELLHQFEEADVDMDSRRAVEDPAGEGPRLFFQRVSEGKQAKNRMHLDLNAAPGRPAERHEIEAETDRLVGLGATRLRVHDAPFGPFTEYHHVLADPEGNEFCVQ